MRLRIGVIGGGLIAQAAHIPNLRRLHDRFELVGLAEPSAIVRATLAERYGIPATFQRWQDLLGRCALDAVVVCSPNATHAEVTLNALEEGLHVLVEKPLCLRAADAELIESRSGATGKTVQVGYMKRYDRAFDELLADLPASTETLRYIEVVTYDPWMPRAPFFRKDELVLGDDVPADVTAATHAAEREQVLAATGATDAVAARTFSNMYLGGLIHDVNLVHGVLEELAEPLPAKPLGSSWWAGGEAATLDLELVNGSRWSSTLVFLRGLDEFQEKATFYFDDRILSLTFPSPYLQQAPTVYERRSRDREAPASRRVESHAESYLDELLHFYDTIVYGVPCRTPPNQSRLDIDVLTDLFARALHTAESHENDPLLR